MTIPDYKKRVNIVIEIHRLWENCAIADVEFDSMMKALYSDITVKQQDKTRLENLTMRKVKFEEVASSLRDARLTRTEACTTLIEGSVVEAIVRKIEEMEKDIQALGHEIRARGDY